MQKIESTCNTISLIFNELKSRYFEDRSEYHNRNEFKHKWKKIMIDKVVPSETIIDNCIEILEKRDIRKDLVRNNFKQTHTKWSDIFYKSFQTLTTSQQAEKISSINKNTQVFVKKRMVEFLFNSDNKSPEFIRFVENLCNVFLVSVIGDRNSVREFAHFISLSIIVPVDSKKRLGIKHE